jgi:nitric oxide synthase-interacting protein
MKGMIEVKFAKDHEDKSICPACLKTLSNSSKLSGTLMRSHGKGRMSANLLCVIGNVVMRNCGHVVCHNCVDMFIKKSKKCYVCEEKTKPKDIVDMTSEGTGYASGSSLAMAERFDLAFQ